LRLARLALGLMGALGILRSAALPAWQREDSLGPVDLTLRSELRQQVYQDFAVSAVRGFKCRVRYQWAGAGEFRDYLALQGDTASVAALDGALASRHRAIHALWIGPLVGVLVGTGVGVVAAQGRSSANPGGFGYSDQSVAEMAGFAGGLVVGIVGGAAGFGIFQGQASSRYRRTVEQYNEGLKGRLGLSLGPRNGGGQATLALHY